MDKEIAIFDQKLFSSCKFLQFLVIKALLSVSVSVSVGGCTPLQCVMQDGRSDCNCNVKQAFYFCFKEIIEKHEILGSSPARNRKRSRRKNTARSSASSHDTICLEGKKLASP
jgi:hypothetical protein